MHALRMRDIHLAYDRPILRGIDLDVEPEQMVVLKGRSGAGKSSLLAIAAGLEKPDQGAVEVAGQDVRQAHVRGRHIGLVFQHLHLLGELNVRENIALPLQLRRWKRADREERVGELLATFGLHDLANRMPASLSGGEQQRVAIARALAPGPSLLLVDEPTGNLDAANARTVVEALRRAAAQGAGVLVVTHDDVFDTTWTLEDGELR